MFSEKHYQQVCLEDGNSPNFCLHFLKINHFTTEPQAIFLLLKNDNLGIIN